MFTIKPSENEKRAFTQILYTACMVDKHIDKIEEDILNAIGKDIFSLSHIDQINLNDSQLTTALGEIQDRLLRYYLIAIVLEIGATGNKLHIQPMIDWTRNLIRQCRFPEDIISKIKMLLIAYHVEPEIYLE